MRNIGLRGRYGTKNILERMMCIGMLMGLRRYLLDKISGKMRSLGSRLDLIRFGRIGRKMKMCMMNKLGHNSGKVMLTLVRTIP